jgi:hypothetical protein
MASASYTVLPRVVVLLLLQVLLADFPTQLQVIRACVKKISISILPPLPSFLLLSSRPLRVPLLKLVSFRTPPLSRLQPAAEH